MRSATAWATAVFPEAVGPKIARTVSAMKSRAGATELVVREAGVTKEALDASVRALELLEDADHRRCRRLRDPLEPLELLVALGRREPLLVARPEPDLAERVVVGDLLDVDAGQVEQKRAEQACAVLAADAMDEDGPVGCIGDRADARGDICLEVLEKDQVDVAGRGRDIGRCADCGLQPRLDLLPLAL